MMTREADLQRAVIDLAQLHGLLVHHCRPARMQSGKWATPLQGAKGFPDLVIAGPAGTLFRELKSTKGQLSAEQVAWLDRLRSSGADASVWCPADWPRRIQAEIHAVSGKAS